MQLQPGTAVGASCSLFFIHLISFCLVSLFDSLIICDPVLNNHRVLHDPSAFDGKRRAMRCNITSRRGLFVNFYRIQRVCAWKVGKVGLLFILNKHDEGWIVKKRMSM